MILEKAPEMDKAVRHLRFLSANERAKQLEEERLSGIALRNTLLGTARREGEIEGRRKGEIEGKRKGLSEGLIKGKVEILFKDMELSTEEIAKKLYMEEDYIVALIKEISLI